MSSERLLRDTIVENDEKICYEPYPEKLDGETQDYLIYFITGNPGLISFYQPFLSHLHSQLVENSVTSHARFHICGHSFRGMEVTQNAEHGGPPKSPLDLEDQILWQDDLFYDHIESHRERTGNNPKVILMGHSVGAYILLELIQRHPSRIKAGAKDFDLIGGILLFPTITNIAQSPLGKVASIVLEIPYLSNTMGYLARLLAQLLSASLLYRLVKLITGFPKYSAATTVSFIGSPMGVRQALYLARDEMRTITEDKWDRQVWGAAMAEGTNDRDTANANLTLYWGKKDRWVADRTRDELIEARGHRSPNQSSPQTQHWKPAMLIDEEGIPHDFCTTERNSKIVADKVKCWVDGIIQSHKSIIS